MPPATLASMARLMPAAMARSQMSAPHSAISSLFAVTTDFLCAMAASIISRATVAPPTNSATMSTSGCATTSRQSVVCQIETAAGGRFLLAIERLQSALTRNGKPSLPAICEAFSVRIVSVPLPTFPKPMMPTLTSCICNHYAGSEPVLSLSLVVVARLEKIDSSAAHFIYQAMFLRDPSRPRASKLKFKRLRLAHSVARIFQDRIDQFKDSQSHPTVVLDPPP